MSIATDSPPIFSITQRISLPSQRRLHPNLDAPPPGVRALPCPVANVIELFGDKWTLLVVRDLILRKAHHGELALSPEGIPTNILADRLKKLEQTGVVEKKAYCKKPVR